MVNDQTMTYVLDIKAYLLYQQTAKIAVISWLCVITGLKEFAYIHRISNFMETQSSDEKKFFGIFC